MFGFEGTTQKLLLERVRAFFSCWHEPCADKAEHVFQACLEKHVSIWMYRAKPATEQASACEVHGGLGLCMTSRLALCKPTKPAKINDISLALDDRMITMEVTEKSVSFWRIYIV